MSLPEDPTIGVLYSSMEGDRSESTTPSGGLVYHRNPEVLSRRHANGVLLLCPGAESPVFLEGSAPAIWALLERPASLGQLAEDLAEVFGQSPGALISDLKSLLENLMIEGALLVD
ncbi:unannotated protein [freshwater metagenome]|uniref:Unannotated protein n=2 Tax=freshwater metagenome TaxID=449393 RepID=A0A6J6QBL3_9ZZZZ